MKLKLLFMALGLVYLIPSHAQNETDALRYSLTTFGGTARSNAMGGAFGALGGDMSAMSFNPAGLGVYRRSEFSFSLGFDGITTGATYQGNTTSEGEPNLNISNIGLVAVVETNENSGWRHAQIGFGYNRMQTFHSDYSIQGTVEGTTLLDAFADQAAGTHPDDVGANFPFGAGLAYNTYLIDPTDSLGTAYTTQMNFGMIDQQMAVHTSGRAAETTISFAGNYDDRIYVGGSVGFPAVRYREETLYTENGQADSVLALDQFTYGETLQTSGNGFNAKFGLIFRPIDFMRIGVAAHTPTWYSMTDTWSADMTSSFQEGSGYQSSYEDFSPSGRYDYRVATPARFIGSLAFIIGKKGLISGDYEHIDYSSARLRPSSTANFVGSTYNFTAENAQIDRQFVSTGNIRLGTEWRFNPWRVRAGYALYGNPYASDATAFDASRTSYTGGFGYRSGNFYTDVSYVRTVWSSDYYLYDPALVSVTELDNAQGKVAVTVGFRY